MRNHLVAILGVACGLPALAQTVSADRVLLVENLQSPVSRAIAADYARRRGVDNVVRIDCADSAASRGNETITARAYRHQIEAPVRRFLARHPGIDYIVLTKGVPIRVLGGETGERYGADGGAGARQASVDGTLAALDYDTLPGARRVTFDDPDGYAVGSAWLNRYWNAKEPFSHARFGGYIVARLDAFTPAGALDLTRRAMLAEAEPPDGPVLLDVEPDFGASDPATPPTQVAEQVIRQELPFDTWNTDMRHAAIDLEQRGIDTIVNDRPAFAGDVKNLSGYYSWGSNDTHWSPDAYHSLGFQPGAIGDTAVSTSALSMLPPGSDAQSAIGDLIAQGITGVKGYINEPLLQAISSPSITLNRYTRGFTLGESFFAGSRFVGWTDLVVGDPLAQPYRRGTMADAR